MHLANVRQAARQQELKHLRTYTVGAHFDEDHTEREAAAFKAETVECDPLCPLDVQADKVEAMDAKLLEVVADWATLYAHHRRRDQAARLQIGHARHHL